jgi:arsenate reductase
VSDPASPPALQRVVDDVALDWLGTFTPETIGRFVQESYEALARRGPGSPHLIVLTERFVRERLRARAQEQGVLPKTLTEVLFVCREFPKPLTDEVVGAADVVVTMGCGDTCPIYPGTRYVDWPVADPAGRPLADVRTIRDDIEHRIRELLDELVPDAGTDKAERQLRDGR